MKILECNGNGGIGFIDPYIVNDIVLKQHAEETEDNIVMILRNQFHCSEILFPYRHK